MSLDLDGLFGVAQQFVNQAVDTSGTRIQFYTEVREPLKQPVKTVFGNPVAAIITVVGATNGASAREELPGITLMPTDWKIICKASTSEPPDGSLVDITRCRDRALQGRVGKLIGVKRDSSGAHVTLFYRPQP